MLSNGASVFLVTANRLLRETLARVLAKKGGLKVCGASACLPNISDSIVESGAEILVLDAINPNQPDCGLIFEIRRRSGVIKVVLIDMEEDSEVFLECARAGVLGYLLKDASANDVLSGIRSVSQGHAVYPPQLCLPLLRSVSRQSIPFPSARIKFELGLTRRQQQLVPMIAEGLTNKEIASRLNLSEQTIKNHVHHMLRRVGVKNRLEVIDAMRDTFAPRGISPHELTQGYKVALSGRHILETH